MNFGLRNSVTDSKPLAIIGFSKEEIRNLIEFWKLDITAAEDYVEKWDFNKQPVCYLQNSRQKHFFLYLSDKKYEKKMVIKAINELICAANNRQFSSLQILFEESSELNLLLPLIAKQVFLSDYSFDKYKENKNHQILQEIEVILQANSQHYDSLIHESKTISEAIALTRDLVNEPSNVIYPQTLAEAANNVGREAGFDVQILDEKDIETLNMHAFLSVAKGSEKPPRLIVMKYFGNPQKSDTILGLIGKGLTYDSGGYSIKSTEGMFTMKADMAGAASVIGAMYAISKQKLRCNVTAVVAACENLISGKAYKPGEIISSMSGKSIEIGNTDAEGRLTLIDALFYTIQEQKVTKVVDVATLTGAVVIGLGNIRTGVISNDDSFYNDLEKASQLSLERIWRLPHDDEYQDLLKSDIADISNTGGRMAGTITAGLFIKSFLPKSIPWLHMDIAGTAYQAKKSNYSPHGATGVPVNTLYNLAKIYSEK